MLDQESSDPFKHPVPVDGENSTMPNEDQFFYNKPMEEVLSHPLMTGLMYQSRKISFICYSNLTNPLELFCSRDSCVSDYLCTFVLKDFPLTVLNVVPSNCFGCFSYICKSASMSMAASLLCTVHYFYIPLSCHMSFVIYFLPNLSSSNTFNSPSHLVHFHISDNFCCLDIFFLMSVKMQGPAMNTPSHKGDSPTIYIIAL